MIFLEKLIGSINSFAGRNAICIQDVHYTYAELASRITSIQHELQAHHSGTERVGVLMADHVDTYASIIALLMLGRTYIPVNPAHPSDRITAIIEQAGLGLILSGIEWQLPAGAATVVVTAALPPKNGQPQCTTGDISGRNAYILFTSGSTGVPKGTPITYHNLNSFVDAFFALGYEVSEQDRFLQMFDLTFDLSVMSYLIPLCIGASLYPVPEKGMKFTNVYSLLENYELTFALMVPSILSFLRPYFSEIELPSLRYSLFCGEALHKDLALEWMKCVPNAIVDNVYGPTEATIFCLTYRVSATQDVIAHNGVVCIGHPMEGMGAIVADESNNALPDGEKGELCLSGAQVTPGYLDPEKSRAAFFDRDGTRYYRTGDIAMRRSDGNYLYFGRLDHQVKIQGFRVELGDIEHHARAVCGCNAVAIATTSAQGVSQVELVVECAPADKEAVLAGLRQRLPSYMVPTGIHFVSPFPLNVNGKTDRKALGKLINGA